MKMLRAGSLFLALGLVANAQIIVFNFNPGSPLAASVVDPHLLSVTSFSVSDGAFTSTAFTTGSPPDSPAVADNGSWDAASPTKYFSFSFTPDAGYAISITGISFDYRQTSSGALSYQVNVGASSNVASGTFTRDSVWRQVSHDSITLSALTGTNEVRIFGYNGGTGSFALDRLTITGSVIAVPEPAACAALAGLVALAGAFVRRRKASPAAEQS